MSVNGLESALYALSCSGSARKRYLDDKDAFLAGFAIDEAEREAVRGEDVAALFRRGVNPMVLMGFYLSFHGPRALPDYLRQVPTLASRLEH